MSDDVTRITALNRAAWDASAPHHGSGAYWSELTEGFATEGFSTLDATLTEALQKAGINGARLVQVGCNNGRETLSACALGAKHAVGIDQSAEFLKQADALRDISGHDVAFLNADIYALPEDVPTGFDIALITIGVLNWMPDLPRFFQAVAGLLRPGGRLMIYETHPFLEMFDPQADDPHRPAVSYFRSAAFVETQSITYDGKNTDGAPETHWFIHTLSHIVQSVLDADMSLGRIEEYPHSIREVEYDIYTDRTAQLPLSFLLTATRT